MMASSVCAHCITLPMILSTVNGLWVPNFIMAHSTKAVDVRGLGMSIVEHVCSPLHAIVSMGLRYRTSPICSPPICFTYTLNPLVGHMSTAYVAQVSEELVMCSRFDFSIYSYESDLALGFEYQAKNRGDNPEKTEKLEGLIKARIGFTEVSSIGNSTEKVAEGLC